MSDVREKASRYRYNSRREGRKTPTHSLNAQDYHLSVPLVSKKVVNAVLYSVSSLIDSRMVNRYSPSFFTFGHFSPKSPLSLRGLQDAYVSTVHRT